MQNPNPSAPPPPIRAGLSASREPCWGDGSPCPTGHQVPPRPSQARRSVQPGAEQRSPRGCREAASLTRLGSWQKRRENGSRCSRITGVSSSAWCMELVDAHVLHANWINFWQEGLQMILTLQALLKRWIPFSISIPLQLRRRSPPALFWPATSPRLLLLPVLPAAPRPAPPAGNTSSAARGATGISGWRQQKDRGQDEVPPWVLVHL